MPSILFCCPTMSGADAGGIVVEVYPSCQKPIMFFTIIKIAIECQSGKMAFDIKA